MKVPLDSEKLPQASVLVTCSSHEERCLGLLQKMGSWSPARVILFHYDDENPRREINHARMLKEFECRGCRVTELRFTESSAVRSLADNMSRLKGILTEHLDHSLVWDLTVFTKRHLLMTARWLDDIGAWDRLTVVYTEPEDYDVSEHVPLSFGLKAMEQIPGFAACADTSRALHLVLFLGYEGDRALASYDHVQPMRTTLILPHPPFKMEWLGTAERLNKELLELVSDGAVIRVDAVDPISTVKTLEKVFQHTHDHSEFAKVICPIGTKPQTFGMYMFVRKCEDPPAVVYAAPMRHNHRFFSHGVGRSWIIRTP